MRHACDEMREKAKPVGRGDYGKTGIDEANRLSADSVHKVFSSTFETIPTRRSGCDPPRNQRVVQHQPSLRPVSEGRASLVLATRRPCFRLDAGADRLSLD